MRTYTSIMNGQCECHVTQQLRSIVSVPASATMLLVLLLAAACHCSLPTPDPSTDPAMAKHLQKMWDGCAVTCPNVNLYFLAAKAAPISRHLIYIS